MEKKLRTKDDLRRKAEEKVQMMIEKNLGHHLLDADEKGLLHELQVQMVELTMQNEELRETHLALEDAKNRYQAFYDSSPACYFTLERDSGIIYDVNLTAVNFFKIPREKILGSPFQSLLTQESADLFHLFLRKSWMPGQTEIMELQVQPHGGAPVKVTARVSYEYDPLRRLAPYRLVFIVSDWFEPKKV